MYTHILISTDGSELAQNGVDHGLSLAKALGSKVTIVTVTEPFSGSGTIGYTGWSTLGVEMEKFEARSEKEAQAILALVKEAADKMGLTAETIHATNPFPAAAIVETAKEQDCNLIVMASHGRRGIRRALLGSQAAEVVSTSNIPVLVIR